MPTITLTPTACTEGSGWKNLYYYATTNSSYWPRQLIFTYPTNAELGGAGINITGITIRGYARNSSSAIKRLRIGCKTSTSAGVNTWSEYAGGSVLDSAFQAVSASNGSYRYSDLSRSLSGDTLARFAGYIHERFASGQPFYLGVIQPDDGKSIQVDPTLSRWTISITYELLGNVPNANVNTATLGSTAIRTTVTKIISGSTTTLRYKIGSTVLSTQNLGTGTSHTYTVPTSAGSNFPSATTATLTIEAETFVGSTSYGTVDTSVTLTLPGDAAPTATCVVSRTWVSGIASSAQIAAYVQSKSGVSFALTGTAQYGASVASFRIVIEGKTYTRNGNGSIAHSPIAGSGTVSYTYTVTDSRGLSRSYNGSVSVLAWSTPKITRFAIDRVTSGNTLAIDGTYARATVQASASSLTVSGSQKNSIKYYVRYREAGSATWTNSDTTTISSTSVNQAAILKKGGAAVGTFNDMAGYEFQLVLQDLYASISAADDMPTKETFLDVNETNGSMGFGGEVTGTGSMPEYTFYGPIHALSGVTGAQVYSTTEQNTGNKWIDGKTIYATIITYNQTSAGATTIPYDFTGVESAWVDASTSFFVVNDTPRTVNHVGYIASNGDRIFAAQLRPDDNQILLTTNNSGTAYIRLLYTKTDAAASSTSAIAQLPADTAEVMLAISNRVGELEKQSIDNIGGAEYV